MLKRAGFFLGPLERPGNSFDWSSTRTVICDVCNDIPKKPIYECSNKHLMCGGCFAKVMADARLLNRRANCPSCSVEVGESLCTRNPELDVFLGKLLPSKCRYCRESFVGDALKQHEQSLCPLRVARCLFGCLGCPDSGPYRDKIIHEQVCPYPLYKGTQLMKTLRQMDDEFVVKKDKVYYLISLLSSEEVEFIDIQLKRDDLCSCSEKCFQSAPFIAVGHLFRMMIKFVPRCAFQLILLTPITVPLDIHYIVVKGPYGHLSPEPEVYRYRFEESSKTSPSCALKFPHIGSYLTCNSVINYRLIVFRNSK